MRVTAFNSRMGFDNPQISRIDALSRGLGSERKRNEFRNFISEMLTCQSHTKVWLSLIASPGSGCKKRNNSELLKNVKDEFERFFVAILYID